MSASADALIGFSTGQGAARVLDTTSPAANSRGLAAWFVRSFPHRATGQPGYGGNAADGPAEIPYDEEVFRKLEALPGKTPNVPFDGDDDL